MPTEPELYYLYRPTEPRSAERNVSFLPVSDFLRDEPACNLLVELITTQFRTRSKFLAVWSGVKFVAVHRDPEGSPDGFLLVNAPVNWQIDYVVVHPSARGQGVAGALLAETLHQAYMHHVPFVTLTSKPSLRGLYEGCGFTAIGPTKSADDDTPSPHPLSQRERSEGERLIQR